MRSVKGEDYKLQLLGVRIYQKDSKNANVEIQ